MGRSEHKLNWCSQNFSRVFGLCRESFISGNLLFAALLVCLNSVALAQTSAQTVNICDRSERVRAAILGSLEGSNECKSISRSALSRIQTLTVTSDGSAVKFGPGDFNDLPGLSRLDLSSNGIEDLPSDLLNGVPPGLTELDVSDNPVTRIPVQILARLDAGGSGNRMEIDAEDFISGFRYTQGGRATTLSRLVLYEGQVANAPRYRVNTFEVSLPDDTDLSYLTGGRSLQFNWDRQSLNVNRDARRILSDIYGGETSFRRGMLSASLVLEVPGDGDFDGETLERKLRWRLLGAHTQARRGKDTVALRVEDIPVEVRETLELRDGNPAPNRIAMGASAGALVAGWDPQLVPSASATVAATLTYRYELASNPGQLFVIGATGGALSLAPGKSLPATSLSHDVVVMATATGPTGHAVTVTARVTIVQDDGLWNICDRTPQVRRAILAGRGGNDCAFVAGPLEFSNDLVVTGSVSALKRGDFRGVRSQSNQYLNLSNLGLNRLSPGVFEGIGRIYGLDISKNELDSLPADVFDSVPVGLCATILHRNPLTRLPARMLARLRSIAPSSSMRQCASPGQFHLVVDGDYCTGKSECNNAPDHLDNFRYLDANTGEVVSSSLVLTEGEPYEIWIELDGLQGVSGTLELQLGNNRFSVEPEALEFSASSETTRIEATITAGEDRNREHETEDLFWQVMGATDGFYIVERGATSRIIRHYTGDREPSGFDSVGGHHLGTQKLPVKVLEPMEIEDTDPAPNRIWKGAPAGTAVVGWAPRFLVDGATFTEVSYSLASGAGLFGIVPATGALSAHGAGWPPSSAGPRNIVARTYYKGEPATRTVTIEVFDTLALEDVDVAQNVIAVGAPTDTQVRGITPVARADGGMVTGEITYALAGGGLFSVNTSSGAISLARLLMDGDIGVYTTTLTASYGGATAMLPLSIVVHAPGRANICDRTPVVQDAILKAIMDMTRAIYSCDSVPLTSMGKISSLDFKPPVAALSDLDFQRMPALAWLDLDGLGLTSLPPGTFRSSTALRTLYLDSNRIKTLPAQLLADLAAVTVLRVDQGVRVGNIQYRVDGEVTTGTLALNEGESRDIQFEAVGDFHTTLTFTFQAAGTPVAATPAKIEIGPFAGAQTVRLSALEDADIVHDRSPVSWRWSLEPSGRVERSGSSDDIPTPDLAVQVNETVTLTDTNAAANQLREDAEDTVSVAGWSPRANVGSAAVRVRYRLAADAGGLFEVDSASGALSLADGQSLNYAASSWHTVVVEANYGGVTAVRPATIEVLDVTAICNRTDAVENAILNATPAGDVCGSVLVSELAAITTLTAVGAAASVTEADFDGLPVLAYLDLTGAGAVRLPVQVVANLADLTRLRLDERARISNIVYRYQDDNTVVTPPLVLNEGASRRLRVETTGGAVSRALSFSLDGSGLQGVTSTVSRLELGSPSASALELRALADADFDPASGMLAWSWLAPAGLRIEARFGRAFVRRPLLTEGLQVDVREAEVFDDTDQADNSISEASAVGDVVEGWSPRVLVNGATATAVRYRLATDAGGLFGIHAASGVLSLVSGGLDYETSTAHTVEVIARVTRSNVEASLTVVIHVGNVPELSFRGVAEGVISEAAAVGAPVSGVSMSLLDDDVSRNDGMDYELTGEGSGDFVLAVSGNVASLQLSDTRLDHETTPTYLLMLRGTYLDATISTRIVVNVLNVLEEVTLEAGTGYEVEEGVLPGTDVGVMLVVKTEDGVTRTSGVSYSLAGSEVFRITPEGEIVVSGLIDYEATSRHNLRITATYGGVTSSEVVVMIGVKDLSLSLPGVLTGEIIEIAKPDTAVSGVEVSALFGETTVTSAASWTLSGTGSDAFHITTAGDIASLQLSGVALDRETTPTYTLELSALYLGESASVRITVNVLNVLEEVILDAGTGYEVEEGVLPGTDVGVMLVVKTEDGVTRTSGVSYSLAGSEVFRITPEGRIVVSGVIDYEATSRHNLRITATYGGVTSSEVTVMIEVKDLSLSLPGVLTGEIIEIAKPDTAVSGVEVSALFGETTVTSAASWTLSGTGSDAFHITTAGDIASLQLSDVALDRETTPTYTLELSALYLGESASVWITVNVLNVLEEVTLEAGTGYEVEEGVPFGTDVGVMLVVKTEDGVTRTSGVSYSLTGSEVFRITPEGRIVVSGVIDYEATTRHSLMIMATYGGVISSEVVVMIGVKDLSLSLPGVLTGEIMEIAKPDTAVSDVEVSALFGGTTVTSAASWTLSGAGSDAFHITTAGGIAILQLSDTRLDRETTPTYTLELSALYLGESASVRIVVNVLNVLEEVTLEAGTGYEVEEGVPSGTDVGVMLVVKTEDGVTRTSGVSYSLTGSEVFRITPEGEIVVSGAIDYEATTQHSLIITATYGGVTSSEVTVMIGVKDLSLSLSGVLSGMIAESATSGTEVSDVEVSALFGETTVTSAASWTLSGTGSEVFRITTDDRVASLQLSGVALDRETTPTYTLELSALYLGESTSVQIVVNVLNVLEEVTLEAGMDYEVEEGVSSGTDVGVMLVVKTEDGVTRTSGVSYSLTGSEVFRITPEGGIVVSGAIDYEATTRHSLMITATYRGVTSSEVVVMIGVKDLSLSLPGVLTGEIIEIAKPDTAVSGVEVSALFGETTVTSAVSWTLSGTGSEVFHITTADDIASLQLSDVALDRETTPTYTLVLSALYLGESTSVQIVVNVLNVLEEVTLEAGTGYEVEEGVSSGTDVGVMLVVKTEDGVTRTSGVSYSLTGSEVFRITPEGEVVVSGAIDYEATTRHSLVITATYGGVTSSEVVVMIGVKDLSLSLPGVSSGMIAENTTSGTAVSDVEVSALFGETTVTSAASWTLSGTGSDTFHITTAGDIASLQLLDTRLDRETTPTYTLVLSASYLGESTSVQIVVNVLNVLEEVVLEAGTGYEVEEGVSSGTDVGVMLVVKTEDGVTRTSGVSYSLTGSEVFRITQEGEIVVSGAIDYEATSRHSLIITATYGGVTSSEVTVMIGVKDLSLSLSGVLSGMIAESATSGTEVSDVEIPALFGETTVTSAASWILSGAGSDTFHITTAGGIASLQLLDTRLDRETTPTYTLVLSASYLGESTSVQIVVNVLNVLEEVVLEAGAGYEVEEGVSSGTDVGVMLVVKTEDGVTRTRGVSYSLTGSEVFRITPEGEIVVSGAIDYEATTRHSLVITATYGGVTSSEVVVMIEVKDLSLSLSGVSSGMIAESATSGTAVSDVEVSALFGETTVTSAASWTLSGTGSEVFRITTDDRVASLQLSDTQLDRETTPTYTLVLSALYLGESTSVRIVVNVLNVLEEVILEAGTGYEVEEGVSSGTDVGVMLVVKTEDGVTRTSGVSYSLTGSEVFRITPEGRIVVSGVIDYEATTRHSLMIMATYGGVISSEVVVMIGVKDLSLSLSGVLTGEIIEIAKPDTAVSDVEVSALFGETTVTSAASWTLSGTGSDAFHITTAGGIASLQLLDVALDRETTPTYTLVLSALYLGEFASTRIVVNVLNVLEEVTLETGTGYEVEEGVSSGTDVGVMLVVKTEDGVTRTSGVSYSLTGSEVFRITPEGEIVVSGVIDYETTTRHSLMITATYGGVISSEVVVMIGVKDLSLSLSGVLTGEIIEIAKPDTAVSDVEVSALFGETTVTSAASWTLSGAGSDAFRITTDDRVASLQLSGVALDRETTPTYTLLLSALYLGEFASTRIVVNVLNVLEEVTLETGTGYEVEEGVSSGTDVGVTLVVKTEDGVTRTSGVSYSLTGSEVFRITPEGKIVVSGAIDYEATSRHSLIITATYGGVTSSEVVVMIEVKDLSLSLSGVSSGMIAENATSGTAVSDVEVSALFGETTVTSAASWALSGTGSDAFHITTAGDIASLQLSDVALDRETTPTYTLVLSALYLGESTSVRIVVNVLNVLEEVILETGTDYEVEEGVSSGTDVGVMLVVKTEDGVTRTSGVSYSLTGSEVFRITPEGKIVVSGAIDYEATSRHSLIITATYGGVTSSEVVVMIEVKDLSLSLSGVSSGMIAENATSGTAVSDVEVSALFGETTVTSAASWALSGTGSDAFHITTAGDIASLQLSDVALDRETTPTYTLVLSALYLGESTSVRVVVNVLNVLEEVILETGTDYEVEEGVSSGTDVGVMLVVKTEDGVTRTSGVSYSLTGSEVFRITPEGGIVVSGVIDYEATSRHSLIITATYGGVTSSEVVVMIGVKDLSLSLPGVSSGMIAESATSGTAVSGVEVSALFGETTVTSAASWTLSGTGSEVFRITTDDRAASLQLSDVALDREATPTYTLVLSALYLSESTSVRITVNVLNVLEEVILETGTDYEVEEGVSSGTDVGVMLVVKTEDGVTRTSGVSYSLTGSEVFRITPEGEIVVSGAIDYEATSRHSLIITATYGGVTSSEVVVMIGVKDLSLSLPGVSSGLIAESATSGTAVSDVEVSALFGETTVTSAASWALSGTGSEVFRITTDGRAASLQLSDTRLDRETTPTYTLVLSASYLGESTSVRIVVNVLNVLEEVTLEAGTGYEVEEGVSSGTDVGVMLVVKTEDGVTRTSGVSYSLTGNEVFRITPEGRIVVSGVIDYEATSRHSMRITATYRGVTSSEVVVMIGVKDLSLSLPGVSSGMIAESATSGTAVSDVEVSALFGETTVTSAASWTLSGTGSGAFRITTDDRVASLQLSDTRLDRETTPTYTLVLSALYLSESTSVRITVNVLNVLEEVTLEAGTDYEVEEGVSSGTDVGVMLVVKTEDGVTRTSGVSYSLTGSEVFRITPEGGVVVSGAIDYEATTRHSLIITATYGGVTSSEVVVMIGVKDLSLSLPGVSSGLIAESATSGTAVSDVEVSALFGETTVTSAASWALSGTGSEVFRITTDGRAASLQLSDTRLDRETTPTYTLVLSASYLGESTSVRIVVNVLNVLEEVTLEAGTGYEVEEGVSSGTDVGVMLVVKTEDGVTRTSGVSYSLTGSEVFRITPEGEIVVSGVIDYEATTRHSLIITATYGGVTSSEVVVMIGVKDLSLSLPGVSSGMIAESATSGTTVSGVEVSALFGETTVTSAASWTLSGTGSEVFHITTAGDIASLQLSDVALDRETTPTYTLELSALYLGESTSVQIVVNVLNVLEEVTLEAGTGYEVEEGVSSGTDVGVMLVVKTEDGVTRTSGVSYSLTGSEVFRITPEGGVVVSGVIDYEATSRHSLRITATYGGVTSSEVVVMVGVKDLSLSLSGVLTGEIIEIARPGTAVSDVEVSALFGETTVTSVASWRLSGTGSDTFHITTAGGIASLQLSDTRLDRETTPTYTLELSALYLGESTSVQIAVNVLNVLEEVTLEAGTGYEVEEGVSSGTDVGVMLVVKTEDGVTRTSGVSYSLTGSEVFRITPEGEIMVSGVIDYEATTRHSLIITATYGGVTSSEVVVMIGVKDLSLSLSGVLTGEIIEIAKPDTAVSDVKVSALFGETTVTSAASWTLSGTGSDAFHITTAGGIASLQLSDTRLDHGTTPTYTLTLEASYLNESTDTQVTIEVSDVNRLMIRVTGSAPYNVSEDAPPGARVNNVSLMAYTEDGVTRTSEVIWHISGVGALFSITSTGAVIVDSALDYETSTSHMPTVTASWQSMTSNEEQFIILVTDVVLDPELVDENNAPNVALNTTNSRVTGLSLAFRLDGVKRTDNVQWTLQITSPGADDAFTIDGGSGEITLKRPFTPGTYTATVAAATVAARGIDRTASLPLSIQVSDGLKVRIRVFLEGAVIP